MKQYTQILVFIDGFMPFLDITESTPI